MRKKICIIVPTHWSYRMGGSQYQVKCLIEKLSQLNGYSVYFLTRNCDYNYKATDYLLEKISSRKGIYKLGFFIDTFSLLDLLHKIRPDVIYQRVGCAYTGIAAYYARNRCEMVWHIAHDMDVKPFHDRISLLFLFRYINQKYLEYGIRNSSKIIAQTNQQGEFLNTYFNREPFAVIRNFHPFPEETIQKDENLIKVVWVANFKPWKQPEQFIQLAEDLSQKYSNIQLVMVGEPSSSEKEWQRSLEKRIEKITCLEYRRALPIKEVNKILSTAHIFVNTSLQEGFANTFIQAWMRKVPVVSLHCNPDKVFDDQKIGFYTGSYSEMLKKIDLLITDKNLREEMGNAAQQYAFREHSEKNIDKLISIFDSC